MINTIPNAVADTPIIVGVDRAVPNDAVIRVAPRPWHLRLDHPRYESHYYALLSLSSGCCLANHLDSYKRQ